MSTTDHDTPVAERVSDAAIREYIEAGERATAGPWEVSQSGFSVRSPLETRKIHKDGSQSHVATCWGNHHDDDSEYRDAAFIAQSRVMGPALAEEVLRLRRVLAAARTCYSVVDYPEAELVAAIEAYDAQEGHADARS